MKTKHLIYLISPFLIGCGADDAATDADKATPVDTTTQEVAVEIENIDLIEPKNVSIFSLGLPIPTQLPTDLKMRKAVHHNSTDGTTTEVQMRVIYNPIEDMIDLHLETNDAKEEAELNIIEMFVHSDYYRTAKGVGVSSSIEEVHTAYPDCLFWYQSAGERYVCETAELPGIQFVFDFNACTKAIKPGVDSESLEITDFNPGSLIEMVRIY